MDQSTDRDGEHDIKIDIESAVIVDETNDHDDAPNNLQVAVLDQHTALGAVEESLFRGRKKPETIMEWCEVCKAIGFVRFDAFTR
jgi:hypothetical protein